MERIQATYLIETPYKVEQAAAVLAGEQSSGTFVSVPGETDELKTRFAARVEAIEVLGEVSAPSMPGEIIDNKTYTQAKVTVSWSVENFGYNIPTLISTLQGNLYELRQFTGLKLDDFELPESYKNHFKGPNFGMKGTKELASVGLERPMIGTIIKPSVGLTPEYTANLVKTLAEAGIDFVKDDELLASSGNSPFAVRVEQIMKVINDFADKTGKKIMYAFNITGDLDTMKTNYDTVVKAGGTCAMMSINSIGWAGVKQVCDFGELSIHGHRNGWGMLNRHPLLGINFPAYNKIWRLAGVDQMHVNGIKNKFWESDDAVVRSIKSCHTPFLNNESVIPVVSSGQWGGQAFETYKRTQTTNLLYMAGGGIMAHPSGPAGGVRALHQAWDSAVKGMTLEETAKQYKEFGESVVKFG
ncbi:ribulose-bisphosphate carboxylase large subunit family protein [Mariniflexile litorale]|uniref:Ribulose-bisphosphate carboxylase large subunit family protein n=1 Tax=Mariniflexile litorale TaxID=3045158 RepID=A0AAU7EFG6_9FLAO|nr:ribulose-bisphosphate carboxylase large subunit family protein [Mariniflexile sp. KMM 9835]MDQ8211798.1 ribulose-bisphosphate carboxylase large subunit family protein [Mariniflexile sp. KMM 9835]